MIVFLTKTALGTLVAYLLGYNPLWGITAVIAVWVLTLLTRLMWGAYKYAHTPSHAYGPRALARTPLSHAHPRNTFGSPGTSLNTSGFDQNSIDAGQAGEQQLFAALIKENIITSRTTCSAWSCPIPQQGTPVADPKYSSDIDAIIVRGRTIYVIDAKRWAGGNNVTYKRKNGGVWRFVDGQPKQIMHLSHNMEMATDRISSIVGPGYKVRGFVCVMPTEKGAARIAPFTFAPGHIPVVSPRFLITLIKSRPALLPVLPKTRTVFQTLAFSRKTKVA